MSVWTGCLRQSDATNSTQRPRFNQPEKLLRTTAASLRRHSLKRRLVAGEIKHAVQLVYKPVDSEPLWDITVFTQKHQRLLAVEGDAAIKPRLSTTHFSADWLLI